MQHIIRKFRGALRISLGERDCYSFQRYLYNNERKPTKFRAEWYLNPSLCDTDAVLYQLSYQANWELVVR